MALPNILKHLEQLRAASLLIILGMTLGLMAVAQVNAAPADQASQQESTHQDAGQAQSHQADQGGGGQSADQAHGQSGEANAHGPSGGGLLSFDVGSYLWKIIVFTIFLFVLAKWVWPPILKGLQDRETKQREDLQSAENAANEANQKLEQYRQQLADAQKESQRIIDQSRTEAQRLDAQLKEQTQHEIQSMRDRAATEINSAKQQAIAEMYDHSVTIATQIAGRILQREIRPEDHRDLIDRTANNIPNSPRSEVQSPNSLN